jgi:hypothetical protein
MYVLKISARKLLHSVLSSRNLIETKQYRNYHGLQIGSDDSFFTATSASFKSPPPQSAVTLAVVGEVEFLPQLVDDVEDAGVSGMT